MKDVVKCYLRKTIACWGSGKPSKNAIPAVRVLMYHRVEPKPVNSYAVSAVVFAEQMKYLQDTYKVVSLDEGFRFLNKESPLKETVVAVTIDDGDACLFRYAFPVLQKYRIPACIFQTTKELEAGGVIGGVYLSEKEIKEMHGAGITFGGHTRNHCRLSLVEKEKCETEINGCKIDLERILGGKVKYFAYPYGLKRHFNSVSVQIVKDSGYQGAFTAINGVNYPGDDLFLLKRTKIERGDSFSDFKKIVNGALDIWGIVDSL